MSTIHPLLLCLGTLLCAAEDNPAGGSDPARLREILYDVQPRRNQSQAALLLVQNPSLEAERIVREGLRQAESPKVFQALAGAVRLMHDCRFADALLNALASNQPVIRQSSAQSLAELADPRVLGRLQALVEDTKTEMAVRQLAVWTLGQSGRREAAAMLVNLLGSAEGTLRQAAAMALADLTGLPHTNDVAWWQNWWARHKELSSAAWLEERLGYQTARARRLESDLERARGQVLRLNQQLYSRLPAGERLGFVQTIADSDDAGLRTVAVTWSIDLLPTADTLAQRAVADLLLRFSNDSAPDVQRSAVLGLGRLKDPRAFDRLRSLLHHEVAPVRAAAARALGQQVRGTGEEASAWQRKAVPALQQALDDPALEVVVEAAESLGTLGIPEAGPVLTVLLHHPSNPVRQTAALALERVAVVNTLDGILDALDDPVVTIRFSLVGALAHAAGDGKSLNERQRARLLARLEELLARDADPGVRSRAATVLGECGTSSVLPALWRRVLATEESRVQDKAWSAIVEIVVRTGSLDLLQEWNRALIDAKLEERRLQLLTEAYNRWQKRDDAAKLAGSTAELLVPVQLAQGKWQAAMPVVRELLGQQPTDSALEKRLDWWLSIGQLALKEGNRQEALRVVQEAQPFLVDRAVLANAFESLEKRARRP
jgi:HEAT repeat protein